MRGDVYASEYYKVKFLLYNIKTNFGFRLFQIQTKDIYKLFSFMFYFHVLNLIF